MNTTSDLLSATTTMGAVTLRVADLDAMIDFYHQGVGLTVLSHTGDRALLGRGPRLVLILQHAPDLKHAPVDHAGLFHTAILFDAKADLAAAVYSVASTYPHAFTGSSDHLVSEAFYFDDPEGNGLELYWDRPRDQWNWTDNRIQMDTTYLDPNAFLRTNLTDAAALDRLQEAPLGVGHVHLKVGNIAQARDFYVDTLGFEETTAFGNQALFVSAGRYHHHVAMNTWQSRGAGPRTPALGLGQVSIELPTDDEVAAVAGRLGSRSIKFRHDGATLTVDDPWNNLVKVTTPQP